MSVSTSKYPMTANKAVTTLTGATTVSVTTGSPSLLWTPPVVLVSHLILSSVLSDFENVIGKIMISIFSLFILEY